MDRQSATLKAAQLKKARAMQAGPKDVAADIGKNQILNSFGMKHLTNPLAKHPDHGL